MLAAPVLAGARRSLGRHGAKLDVPWLQWRHLGRRQAPAGCPPAKTWAGRDRPVSLPLMRSNKPPAGMGAPSAFLAMVPMPALVPTPAPAPTPLTSPLLEKKGTHEANVSKIISLLADFFMMSSQLYSHLLVLSENDGNVCKYFLLVGIKMM